ncbi:hypothetical protein LTR93_011384 [Exophiala xenobiotica]|nr:hypothetical protein LTR93_011384 [Exophiala xenobiotica]
MEGNDSVPYLESDKSNSNEDGTGKAWGRFGQFGGQYVPEALKESLIRLEEAFVQAKEDPDFWKEWRTFSAGAGTLRDATNEALRASIHEVDSSFYAMGSSIGPHPYPIMVRTFQSVIGQETKDQMRELNGRPPSALVACVGGGSNSAGMFFPFASDANVKLIGVEAAGQGMDTSRHSAALAGGTVGVYHGAMTYVMQDDHGQIKTSSTIAAGLDYPGVGPELACWKDCGRAHFITATDEDALVGLHTLAQTEGIIPSLEASHAIWGGMKVASPMNVDETLVICLSGRGDKDLLVVADAMPLLGRTIG